MKILLVDDEYYILNGLHRLIQTHFPELEIFTAEYISDAKELLRREQPDILITDIRIAEDNGLDLLQEAKADLEDMHVYVISGFSEFSYAQRAIELKVREYFLKPINQEKIIQAVSQSIKEISTRSALREDQGHLVKMAREKLIADMIAEGGCSGRLAEEIKRLEMISMFESYQVVSISVREYWTVAGYHASGELSDLKQLMRQTLDRLIEEFKAASKILLDNGAGTYTLVIFMPCDPLRLFLKQIYQAFYDDFQIYTDFRISEVHHGPGQFYEAYSETQNILPEASRLLFYSDEEGKVLHELEAIRFEACRCMKTGKLVKLTALIEVIITKLCVVHKDNVVVRNFTEELYKELKKYTIQKRGACNPGSDPEEPRPGKGSDSMRSAYEHLAKELRACQQAEDIRRNREMIDNVLDYMDRNLASVTLESAAGFLDLTPIYLSIIFKETTGVNFKDCLIRKKMEKARELLVGTDLRVYEISAAVGYSDIKYFSRLFRKFAGLGPQEYRQKAEEKQEQST